MALHLRTQIRNAAAALLAGLATTGSRVFTSRVEPLHDNELPGLVIITGQESVNAMTLGQQRDQERLLSLLVECCVKGGANFEDQIDQIAKEVEVKFATDNTLGALCKYISLQSVILTLQGESDERIATAQLTFEVCYYTAHGAPDVPL